MAQKPAFVQETFKSLDSDRVNSDVQDMVNKHVKEGYEVVVLNQDYLTTYADLSTHMVYQTTVLATLSKSVNISQK